MTAAAKIRNHHEHDLKVRRMDFDFPDDIPDFWYGNDPFRTLLLATLSAGFPDGERFFIDSVRHYRDRITDPALQKAISAFIGQEGHHSKGEKDPYSPRKMADYATNHGRVKGSGTDGSRMMKDLSGSFPGFEGKSVDNLANSVESLRNGIPVMFLGHNVHGTRKDGTDTKYGGHFMTLTGVSDDGKNFNVNDGGRNKNQNIRTMTDKQLKAGSSGYWNVKHNTH